MDASNLYVWYRDRARGALGKACSLCRKIREESEAGEKSTCVWKIMSHFIRLEDVTCGGTQQTLRQRKSNQTSIE